jgi:flagellar hook-length control protein FliK
MAVALSRADRALTLRLNPESLGFVRIRMEVENGTLHARFETSTDQARKLLEQSSETLRASLEAKGWESSRFRVELLREVDPAAEMLRRLEQQAEGRLGRFTAEDSAAESESGAGSSGGDREHGQSKMGFDSQGREGELGVESVQPERDPAMNGVMMVSSSRVDTIA